MYRPCHNIPIAYFTSVLNRVIHKRVVVHCSLKMDDRDSRGRVGSSDYGYARSDVSNCGNHTIVRNRTHTHWHVLAVDGTMSARGVIP